MEPARALVAVAVVLLGACATPTTDPAAPAPVPTMPPTFPAAPNGVDLPTPPPPSVPPSPPPSVPPSPPLAPTPTAAPDIAGYTGDRWGAVLDGEVLVLADTLSLRDGTLRGLVRNGRDEPVGPVTVAVGDSRADVALPVLRPGEPAPFEVALGVDDDAVGQVEDLDVAVTAPTAAVEPPRGMRLSTFWRRGVVDDRPVDTYLFRDPPSGPQPSVAFGEVLAAESVDGLVVVAAWVADDGRVLAVDAEADLQDDVVQAGAAVDFVVTATGPPALDDARLVLWGSGS